MPAPSPGRKRVPRWRTMISPPVTVWPAKTFTPRRFAFESRPLRLEPRPFLCALALGPPPDRGDAQPRQILAVSRAALVAALGLELDHAQLRPALVPHDLRGDGAAVDGVVVDGEQRLEVDRAAGVAGQALDEQGLSLLDAVLLTAGLDDRVAHAASWGALARERRRPPLRPRRRAVESTACPSSCGPPSSSPSGASTSTAVAAVRPASSMRTRRFW